MSQDHYIVGEHHFQERTVTTVLIVEDDPLIAISLQMVLEDEGYEVCGVAATECQAISLGSTHRPDVAVVDARLAEGSGIEAGRRLLDGETRVVFATAYASEIAREFPGMGVPVIEKPYDAQLIVRTVRLLSNDGEKSGATSDALVIGRCRAA
jgi:DNA-binding response OmpR family regulator